MSNFAFCVFTFFFSISIAAAGKVYKVYPYDPNPISKHSEFGKPWNETNLEWKNKVAPLAALKLQVTRIEAISKLEPDWIDGYWLASDANFQAGSLYTAPKDFPIAREFFAKGQKMAETCLKKQADNPLCKFYLGVHMGKIASIDGIFSSLKKAKIIQRLWMEVLDSPYNHHWGPNSSLQGANRYALGIFYRLVPDFFLMQWLFDVKGDLTKSVSFHQESLDYDAPNVCNKMMLAVALICKGSSDFTTESGQAGLKELREAKTYPVTSVLYASCFKDIAKLEADSKKSCGYETSRQQETSEAEFNKQNNVPSSK